MKRSGSRGGRRYALSRPTDPETVPDERSVSRQAGGDDRSTGFDQTPDDVAGGGPEDVGTAHEAIATG